MDLVHFTILRPPEKQDGVPVDELSLIAFPTRELFLEKIDEFDLTLEVQQQLGDGRGLRQPVEALDEVALVIQGGDNGQAVLGGQAAQIGGVPAVPSAVDEHLDTVIACFGGQGEDPGQAVGVKRSSGQDDHGYSLETVERAAEDYFDELPSIPAIRVSHEVKGRIPEARHKRAQELLPHERAT